MACGPRSETLLCRAISCNQGGGGHTAAGESLEGLHHGAPCLPRCHLSIIQSKLLATDSFRELDFYWRV